VVAAGAAEPVRAAGATGLGVGRFGAGAERDGDLADRTAGVFEDQQLLGGSPDTVAAGRTAGGDRVDGFPDRELHPGQADLAGRSR